MSHEIQQPAACTMCGEASFERRAGVLETRAMTYFNLSWANRGKTEFICHACGFIHGFAHPR